ncbi:16S rRNA (cytosine(1402)-N(4))-methyltransferase RsmH [Candidatus Palauibacter polyketidifaciens]|uniref:16S rRNA (cytosine(1402)-N(4))-methyltransferase RsmH n=1 Tax=Candidatus Palauibacter polyketidifaciens TaxID=3056740 RepID=UPI0023A70BF1|nr:16S rRNA (cytosine(1402)-N(4))-methyltransferase RsmH [Candidatus Palauibacter polyketidifaciens]MDE2719015.1 16S rRNA (cytosine(1402)-N(4))-methyltransferase RsmH [Candidatus Palauibacter polyketidifaciens]
MTEETFQHTPVMPDEVLRWLRPECGGVFLDATVGGAGHAIRLLETGSAVRVIGIDQDAEAIEAARRRLASAGERVKLIRANFRDVARPGFAAEMDGLAGALMDLGVSSHQIDTQERGFSFRPGTPLRMRMDERARETRSAAELLNRADERELGRVFRDGEERRWRTLSREVVRRRKIRPFSTSDDLVAALSAVLGRSAQEKQKARLFQALRIAVNDELAALSEGLKGIRGRLAPGGRLAVLSYHSLEDRLVKDAFRNWSADCRCPPGLPECRCRGRSLGRTLTRRPLRPSAEEVAGNPRARSARLRVWEKRGTDEQAGGA